jgi:hypothetical protein
MNDAEIFQLFLPLYDDLIDEEKFNNQKPLLAHYTTIQTLEKILTSNELWFSNPLFMNDMEEVRFGINQGNELFNLSKEVADACGTEARKQLLKQHFAYCYNKFANEHVLNTYVFCLSRHDKDDDDGLLSMWRGYGGNGNGVAIVFDTSQMNVVAGSPLLLAKVTYDTSEARKAWLEGLLSAFCKILAASAIPDNKLFIPANTLFERIKLFALFTKHRGFKEEDEWRVVYMPDRDAEKRLESMFHYSISPRGVEPKLRFRVEPIQGFTTDDLSLTKIIDRVILGPSISSPIAAATVWRMLELLKQPDLKPKLRGSKIPFRAI